MNEVCEQTLFSACRKCNENTNQLAEHWFVFGEISQTEYKITHLASSSHSQPPHLVHLAFQVCMIFVLLCDPIEYVLFQLQPKFTALFFHQGVMHGDTSTSESIHIYLSL